MLLTRQKREPTYGQLNMASMIDVVFLLLIFFMCTSSFRGLENDMATQIPQAGLQGERMIDREPIRVHVAGSAAGPRITCDGLPCATYAELLAQLQARRRIDKFYPVIIESEPSVPFRYVVGALDRCHEAGLHRVAFSTRGGHP